MKKYISIFLAVVMALFCLSACSDNINKQSEKLQIVTTIFPAYDWVKEILGDNADRAELTMLLDNGVDLHSYQPTADDLIKISSCDMFIYVGGESDGWVEGALKNATNKAMVVINLMEPLGGSVKAEEMVEGMQKSEHHHSHDESFTEEDIKDRTLSEFGGGWKSLHPLLLNGYLDEYCEHKAEEDEDDTATKETYIEKYQKSWDCDANEIFIDGNTITFTYADGKTRSAEYIYAGYSVKTSDSGSMSVRYQFQTESNDAPKYVQFNDHGYKPGEVEHFHIYFGDDSFEALMDSKTNPYFVPAAFTTGEVLDSLMEHSHEGESDEHVWLSLKNAKVLCQAIADKLAEADPAHKDGYSANMSAYIAKLSELDAKYKAAVDNAAHKTVLFGDRFPFRYLVDDYGLDYYAAFSGCSAETEASFETISFLSNKVDELGLTCVLTIEGTKHKIAETIISNTKSKNQQVLTMDSLQSTTSNDVKNGPTYLSVMEQNLEVLKDALK